MSVPVESGLFSNWNDIHYNHEQLFASVVHVLIGALNFFCLTPFRPLTRAWQPVLNWNECVVHSSVFQVFVVVFRAFVYNSCQLASLIFIRILFLLDFLKLFFRQAATSKPPLFSWLTSSLFIRVVWSLRCSSQDAAQTNKTFCCNSVKTTGLYLSVLNQTQIHNRTKTLKCCRWLKMMTFILASC